MKKLLFLATLVVGVTACCTNGNTIITGRLSDLPDGTKITLIPGATHVTEDFTAEAVVANGEFMLEPVIEEPRVFYLRAEGMRGGSSIMVAPGERITITGTLSESVVSGSVAHELYVEKFDKPRNEINRLHGEMQETFADILRRMGEARRNKDAEATAGIRASDEWQALEQAEHNFFGRMGEMLDKAVADNADTYWGPLLLMLHTAYLTPENERHYDMFTDEAKKSYYGRAVAAEIFGISGTAPAFTAKDIEGNEHSLNDLLEGDNYILVDFWASWCGPCRNFVPKLKELASKYADKGLVVVSISTDTNREAWLKAVEEEQMPWLNMLDESGISTAYGVSSIPSLFLIDPVGEIVFGKQSGQMLVDKLEKVFDK